MTVSTPQCRGCDRRRPRPERRSSPLGDAFHVFDTTLRDGAQREGITYSVADKLAVARLLDELGVGFIEGGWPGAMPKDTEFFARAARRRAGPAHRAAGRVRRHPQGRRRGPQDDPQVRALLDSGAPVVTLVAKSDVRHVERALRTTLEENLAMVADTVRFLVATAAGCSSTASTSSTATPFDRDYGAPGRARPRSTPAPTSSCCATPTAACCRWASHGSSARCVDAHRLPARHPLPGRHRLRGGQHHRRGRGRRHPRAVHRQRLRRAGRQRRPVRRGRQPGRPRWACRCYRTARLAEMMRVSHALAEIANIAPNTHQAYVGSSAFAHKAGLHACAIKVDPELYNHLDPAVVGNDMHILVTEMAGRACVELKAPRARRRPGRPARGGRPGRRHGQGRGRPPAGRSRPPTPRSSCWCATSWPPRPAADGAAVPPGVLPGDRRAPRGRRGGQSEATVKVHVGGERMIATAEGNGPVNALDAALRSALSPSTSRELDRGRAGRLQGAHPGRLGRHRRRSPGCWSSSARGAQEWTTVGVHANVVEASWQALVDALVYALRPQTPEPRPSAARAGVAARV